MTSRQFQEHALRIDRFRILHRTSVHCVPPCVGLVPNRPMPPVTLGRLSGNTGLPSRAFAIPAPSTSATATTRSAAPDAPVPSSHPPAKPGAFNFEPLQSGYLAPPTQRCYTIRLPLAEDFGASHPPLRPQDAGEGWGGGECLGVASPHPNLPPQAGEGAITSANDRTATACWRCSRAPGRAISS